jgi:hydrogenase maturation protein HypF
LAEWVLRAVAQSKINHVVLGGGCFLNTILTQALTQRLSEKGLRVLTAQQLPSNDGGISLGQASVAIGYLISEININ